MRKIAFIGWLGLFLLSLNTLQASKLPPTPSDEPSEGVTKTPSTQAAAKDSPEGVLKEGRRVTDEEALAAASRRADRMLGLKRKKRRGRREK